MVSVGNDEFESALVAIRHPINRVDKRAYDDRASRAAHRIETYQHTFPIHCFWPSESSECLSV